MEVINKPFGCPEEDCTFSFVNEDHLVVHKKKHDLSLSLTPTPYKTLLDQTPTPSRFISTLDSAELFQDLNGVNPFDATFRKALGNGTPSVAIPESSSFIASLPETSDVLNTPSITLPSEPATPIFLKSDFLKSKLQKQQQTSQSQNECTDSLPFSPHERQSLENEPSTNTTESILDAEMAASAMTQLGVFLEESQSITQKNIASKSNVMPTPVIKSVGSINVPKSNVTCVPTAVVTRQITNAPPTVTQVPVLAPKPTPVKVVEQSQAAVLQSVCVTQMLQLMIRLPDGQTIPVQFPAAATNIAQPAVIAQPVQPIVTAVENESPTANILAKMIAKKNSSSTKTKTRLPPVQPISSSDLLNEYGLSPPPSPVTTTQKSGHAGRKRSDIVDSLDDKRRRSLERNRAAATRCREKRKQWITALEKKADELSVTNTHLQQEVATLRNEVAHLKTLLLAHKDCPVTQQQKAISYEAEREIYTIQVITAEDLQRVPNSSEGSPIQTAEYMEVDMSSVQSSSDLSLGSEGSDASFKER